MDLGSRFVAVAKERWNAFCLADSTGRTLTSGRTLVAALMLARRIRRLAGPERNIGLLLPASVGGALANVAAILAGKVPVNLNFTAGPDAIAHAIDRCAITTILTSRTFLTRAQIESAPGMIYLEDVLGSLGRFESLITLALAYILPATLLTRLMVARVSSPDDTATIIFSSGSTGIPKGVVLSHRNILANIDAIGEVFQIKHRDVMIGVLPFFHSFGFTTTLWFPLIAGFGVAYHPNPTDAKTIGDLAERVPRNDPRQHADVLRGIHQENQAGTVRAPANCDGRRRETPRTDRQRVSRQVRTGSARRLRLHRNVAGGFGERS